MAWVTDTVDLELALIVRRLNKLGLSQTQIKEWVGRPLNQLHNGTVFEFVQLGLGYLVLNRIDEMEAMLND